MVWSQSVLYIKNVGYTANGSYTLDFTCPSNLSGTTYVWFESAVTGLRLFYLDDVSIEDIEPSVAFYYPQVASWSDYYPFGMQIPGKNGNTPEYRYGFQGQEKDDEIKGNGNSINYEYRMYDPRIGRFFAVDPLDQIYPYYSPYIFSGNRVIDSKELEGKEPTPAGKQTGSGHEGKTRTTTVGNLVIGFLTYTQVYHCGGRFTQAGWYIKKDYDFITKPKHQDRDAATMSFIQANPRSAYKIGDDNWADDGDISSYSIVAATNAKIAGNSEAVMQGQNNDGTILNAFRHAIWQSLITYEIDYNTAAQMGYAHEQHPNADLLVQNQKINQLNFANLPAADNVIDLMNNRLARQMAQGWKNEGLNLTRKDIAIRTLEYFSEKGFYVATQNDDGTYGVSLYRLSDEELNRGYTNLMNTDKNGFNNKDKQFNVNELWEPSKFKK